MNMNENEDFFLVLFNNFCRQMKYRLKQNTIFGLCLGTS
jgi:hypothetical protein